MSVEKIIGHHYRQTDMQKLIQKNLLDTKSHEKKNTFTSKPVAHIHSSYNVTRMFLRFIFLHHFLCEKIYRTL